MPIKPKEKVEEIKKEAKQYYKWKNMISRYILIWFLVILIWLQFFLPKNGESNEENIPTTVEKLDTTFTFLWEDVDTNNIYYDQALVDIISNGSQLALLYKKSLSVLPDLEKDLEKEGINTDLQYLALLNELEDPIRDLNYEFLDELIISEEVDERLNKDKTTSLVVEYLDNLYEDFEDWNLVLVWYFVWEEELKDTMMDQDQKEFINLYLDSTVMYNYYKLVAYKYVIENISNYIDTRNIEAYPEVETETEKVWETKDIVKRAKKEWYTFKEIKELNPWILENSLPKGKWEIKVYWE